LRIATLSVNALYWIGRSSTGKNGEKEGSAGEKLAGRQTRSYPVS
jgi:hypothetical protein